MNQQTSGPSALHVKYLKATVAQLRATSSDRSDFAAVRRRLHRGVFADVEGELVCSAPDPDDLQRLRWLRLLRMEAPVEGRRPVVVDALSAMAMSATPLAVLVSGNGVHLGHRPDDRAAVDWLASVLAPGTVFASDGGRPVGSLRLLTNGLVNGVYFGLTPSVTDVKLPTGVPGLTRLMLSPPGEWAVMFLLDPISFKGIRDVNDHLAHLAMELARFGTVSDSTSAQAAVTIERPEVQSLLTRVNGMLAHLEAGEAVGLWGVSTYVAASIEPTLEVMTGVVGSVLAEERLAGNRWISYRYPVSDSPHVRKVPLAPVALMSTDDIGQLLETGEASLPGLEVATAPPAGRRTQVVPKPLRVGRWLGTAHNMPIDVMDLEGHAFVTGTTGTGKSTTVQGLLLDLWNEHQIRFLIIDPVKADYEDLAPLVIDGLTTIDATDLVLNVLDPWPGFPVRTHLELVSNAFKGSFSMPSPVPYIVSQLFERLIARAECAPSPTLHDLRDLLDPFVRSLGYDGEIESNIRASLGLRLSLLLSPAKAERLAAPAGTSLRALFERPAVVQLSTLGDEEERAFLMSVLTLYVTERAKVAGPNRGVVRHVTVLEEAHRILPEPREGGSAEEGDAASVSSKLLTQLLAEIRSYGEAVIVVDQSPAAVARDVVRNTNLKIAHRLPDPADRELVGGSMGMSEEQLPSLARLARGEALLTTRRAPEAQAVAIRALPDPEPREPDRPPRSHVEQDPRTCCQGRRAVIHHAAEARSRDAEAAVALALTALAVGAADWRAVWQAMDTDLATIAAQDPQLAAEIDDASRCLLWIGLRRSLLRHVAFGHLSPSDVESRLRQVYTLTSQRRGDRRISLVSSGHDATAAFYGCRWCDAVCRFRHVGETSPTVGAAAARDTLAPLWSPGAAFDTASKLKKWRRDTLKGLGPVLGEASAYGVIRCALVNLAAAAGMPRPIQDALLAPEDGEGERHG